MTPIPDELESADAAPMLCAGITTYAALRRSGAKSGQWVVIAGAGGGLGHIGCMIASGGMALRVIGIDRGSKEQLAKDCGVEHFIDITKHDDNSIAKEVLKITGGLGASAVIVCTGGLSFSSIFSPNGCNLRGLRHVSASSALKMYFVLLVFVH